MACEYGALGTMGMLIAAYAVAEDAVLIANDKAFYCVEQYLALEDWTQAR